jgi:hypothetical protein
METNWAAEHLQTIRTLMERSAVYRRALAPIMLFVGVLGAAAAILGWVLAIDSPRAFILYWAAVAALALAGSFLLVRRQALKDSEPFWSPPTKRVAQALLPPFAAGFLVAVVIFLNTTPDLSGMLDMMPVIGMLWLPLGWVVLYGCALHSAGFFTPRGMRIFGWLFILGGCGLFAIGLPDQIKALYYAHGIMGFFFGLLHVAYGGYLYLTENRKNAT